MEGGNWEGGYREGNGAEAPDLDMTKSLSNAEQPFQGPGGEQSPIPPSALPEKPSCVAAQGPPCVACSDGLWLAQVFSNWPNLS